MSASFITGVDSNHEWMLEWWFNNIRKHSDIPITICDFGMSDKMSNWAEMTASHFIKYPKHHKCAWFYKSQCLLDSPFEKTCWLDADCQVLTNIDDIFKYAHEGKLGLTRDVGRGKGWWATGVVVIKETIPKCASGRWTLNEHFDQVKNSEWITRSTVTAHY